ncbi:MAG: hypothetical protein WDK95_06120 [Syntrophorhabdaceae bacterium]
MFNWFKNLFNLNKKRRYWNLDFSFMKTDKNGRRYDNNYPSHILGFKNPTPLPSWGSCDVEDFENLLRLFINHQAFNKLNRGDKFLVFSKLHKEEKLFNESTELTKRCASPCGIVTGEPPKTK